MGEYTQQTLFQFVEKSVETSFQILFCSTFAERCSVVITVWHRLKNREQRLTVFGRYHSAAQS